MSRCSLDNYGAGYEVVIGWDGQLQTFFAQVIDINSEEKEDEGPFIWLGVSPRECSSPEPLIEAIKPYATGFDTELLLSILKLDKKTNSERRYFFQDNELCVCSEDKEDLLRKLQEEKKGFWRRLFRL